MITIAQALHWFNFDHFYQEAKRVLKMRCIIAAWTYSFLSASPLLGKLVEQCVSDFYHHVIGPYWPKQRLWVDELYETIPFLEQDTPSFSLELSWDLQSVIGYISSWSAVAEYQKITGVDPLPDFAENLRRVWGKKEKPREMKWPLALRVGTFL